MNCPNCGSSEIYRKNLTHIRVYCDRCSYSWEVKQAKKPLLREKVYMSRGSMRGTHHVSVWYCPTDRTIRNSQFAIRNCEHNCQLVHSGYKPPLI